MRIFNRNKAPDAAKEKKKGRKENGKGMAGKGAKDGKKTDKDSKKRSSSNRRNPKDSETASTSSTSGDSSSDSESRLALEEVMKGNLDLMLEIILRIREDEDYAKNIYADCPRLQHLLDRNPDLRPIFEDPNLVRINFEHVYKKCGGVLPEETKPWYIKVLAVIVNHPLFKVFRFLLFIKKLYSCIFNGGFLMIRNLFASMFYPSVEAPDADALADGLGNPDNLAAKEALWQAAERMEQPEVRDQMDVLLEGDPDDLEEMIENDPELTGLRESSPLCAELMSDPTTLRILVDPDNLRALGDCADMIEQDFADPNWTAPDVESIPYDDPAYVEAEAAAVADFEVAHQEPATTNLVETPGVEVDGEGEGEDAAGEYLQEEGSFLQDFERGDEPEAAAANKKQEQKKQEDDKNEGGGGPGGFLATIGTGLIDYVAAQTVGMTATEMMNGGGGGDDFGLDEFEGLDDQAQEAVDQAQEAKDAADEAAANAAQVAAVVDAASELAAEDDLVANIEGTMDEVEDAHEERQDKDDPGDDALDATQTMAAATVMSTGASGMYGMIAPDEKKKDRSLAGVEPIPVEPKQEEPEQEEQDCKPKSRFRKMGSAIGVGLTSFGSATKQFAATALGADLASELLDHLHGDKKSKDKDGNGLDDDDNKQDNNDDTRSTKNGEAEEDKENDTKVKDKSQGSLSWSGSGFFGKQN